ncbi:MAG: signal peptidase II [Polyangiaceae bacterium]
METNPLPRRSSLRSAMTWILLLLAAGLAGCDHATKYVAQQELSASSKTIVPGVVELVYSENRDTAFSLFRSLGGHAPKALLVILPLVALVAVAVFAWKRRRAASKLELTGYAVIFGGALGNVIDRVFRGYVIDFIHVRHWPVFNVADIAVGVGVGLLVLSGLLRPKTPAAPDVPAPS